MAKCQNCGSNDADIDWGLCYQCFCQEDDRGGGHLSSIAAMGYESMGMHDAAVSCRSAAKRKKDIKNIVDKLEHSSELINSVMDMLNK